MQITHALLALLAVPAARSLPIQMGVGTSNLAARGAADSGRSSLLEANLFARKLSPEARDAAESARTIYARYASIQDDGERSVAVVRDLQRRGIIDTLVQAIAAILTELLGTDGAPARHYRRGLDARQLTVLGMQTGSIVDDITCLLLKLFGINDSNCAGKPSKRDVTNASNSFTGINTENPEAMRESLGELLSHIGRALEHETFDGSVPAMRRDGGSEDFELLARQFPANLGVEGLLEVLRTLLDTVLNTLLPLSPRSAAASPTSAALQPTATNCPPPGTPNDGMYRPGCPGYGRRDVSAEESDQLEQMATMLETLIEKLQPMVQKTDAAATSATGSTDADTSASPAATDAATSGSAGGSQSSAVEDALAQLSSSASTPDPSAAATGDAATPTVAARDFLEADGFRYVKRQVTADAATADATATSSAADSTSTAATASPSDSGSFSMVKSIVSELFSMMSGGAKSASTSDSDSSASSGSSDSFMTLVSSVLGGLSSRDVPDGPIQRSAVEKLVDRALAGNSPTKMMARGMAARYVGQAVTQANTVLNARADFSPVWDEVKKLGNSHFHHERSISERDNSQGSFQDVWENFSKMIDASIAQEKQKANKREAVDVKPFADAATRWAQKTFAHKDEKVKRDLEQYKPLANAAGSFAKQQMEEWTTALKKYNANRQH